MTEEEDEAVLDKIYSIMEEWWSGKSIKPSREYLDSVWEIIKDWYYSKPFIDVSEYYEE